MKRLIYAIGIVLLSHIAPSFAAVDDSLSLKDFAVPESLGKISERFEGASSDRTIIQIQDVHAHYTAQENIAAILDQLNAVYDLQTVALEGGWSATSLPQSWSLPSSRGKYLLAQNLLQDAYIGGPVYAALFSQKPITLVGIEDRELYLKNRDIYLKYLADKERIDLLLKKASQDIHQLKQTAFNPELAAFDAKRVEFLAGKKAESFLPYLITKAGERSVDLAAYPQIALFKEILTLEAGLDAEKLKSEAARLMDSLPKGRITFEEALRAGKFSEEKLAYYSQTRLYRDIMKRQDELSHQDFFAEIEALTAQVEGALTATDAEKALAVRAKTFALIETLASFKATPADIRKYEAEEASVQAEAAGLGLTDPLALAADFYRLAKQRDEIFFKKITTEEPLGKDIAVVTGGFHTDGLSELFRHAGISYIVVTPDLGKESMSEKLYFSRMQSIPMTQTLSSEGNRYALLDEPFAQAVEGLEATSPNIPAAERTVITAIEGAPSGKTARAEARAEAPGLQALWDRFVAATAPEEKKTLLAEMAVENLKLKNILLITDTALREIDQNAKNPALAEKLWKGITSNRNNFIFVYYQSLDYPDWAAAGAVYQQVGNFRPERFASKYASEVKGRRVAASIDQPDLLGELLEQVALLPNDLSSFIFFITGAYQFAGQNAAAAAFIRNLAADAAFAEQLLQSA
ncbi:MAG: hypothetical protein ACOY3K_04885 [Candidatus Omnitrophota bacterium]